MFEKNKIADRGNYTHGEKRPEPKEVVKEKAVEITKEVVVPAAKEAENIPGGVGSLDPNISVLFNLCNGLAGDMSQAPLEQLTPFTQWKNTNETAFNNTDGKKYDPKTAHEILSSDDEENGSEYEDVDDSDDDDEESEEK